MLTPQKVQTNSRFDPAKLGSYLEPPTGNREENRAANQEEQPQRCGKELGKRKRRSARRYNGEVARSADSHQMSSDWLCMQANP